MGGRTGLLACLPESSFALPSPQYLFPHRDTANEIEIDGVAEAGFVAQRDGAVRGGFYGGLDDVLFPVAPAGGDVAGQHEIRQAGQGDIVGAPDAGLQHAAAPDRDAGGLGDIVHPFGLAESKPNAGPQSGAADPAKARQLLARAQQAVGGAEKLAAVQDMLEVAELHVDPNPSRTPDPSLAPRTPRKPGNCWRARSRPWAARRSWPLFRICWKSRSCTWTRIQAERRTPVWRRGPRESQATAGARAAGRGRRGEAGRCSGYVGSQIGRAH